MRLYPEKKILKTTQTRTTIDWKTNQTFDDVFTFPLEDAYGQYNYHYYGILQHVVDLWNAVRGTTSTEDPCPLPEYKSAPNTYLDDGKLLALSTNYHSRVAERYISANVDNVVKRSYDLVGGYEYTKYYDYDKSRSSQSLNQSIEYQVNILLAKQFILKYGDALAFIRDMYEIDYDPLENYNGTEEITYGDFITDYLNGKSLDRTYNNLRVTHTPTNYTHTTTQKTATNLTTTQSNVNINKGVGYDSTAWRNQENDRNDQTVREYGTSDGNQTTIRDVESGSYNDATSGGYRDANSGTDKQTEHEHTVVTNKHGNLGVTTSCQMKTAEVDFWSNPNNIEIGILFNMLDRLTISKIY